MSLSDVLAVFQLKHVISVFVARYEKCHKCMQAVNHRGKAAKSKLSGPTRITNVLLLPLSSMGNTTPKHLSGNCPR